MRRIAECMWRIQEKFPVRATGTTEMRTEKGMRDNAHRPKNAGFQDNTGLFPFVLNPHLHRRRAQPQCQSWKILCCPPGSTQTCFPAHIVTL